MSKQSGFLLKISKELIKQRDFLDLSSKVLFIAKDAFGLVNCGILLYDASRKELFVKSFSGRKKSVKSLRIGLNQGITGRCAKLREPVYVPDVSKEKGFIRMYPSTKSELAIPLIAEKRLLGVLNFENKRVRGFSNDDIELLEAFASIVSIALENALLFEDISNKDRQKNELIDIAKVVSELMGKQNAFGKLVSLGGKLIKADSCAIALYDPEQGTVTAKMPGYGVQKEKLKSLHYHAEEAPITGKILKTGIPFMTNDVDEEPSAILKKFSKIFKLKRLIISPLKTSKEVIGLFFAARKKEKEQFTEEDRDIMIIYSSLAAALIKRMQIFDELKNKQKELELLTGELKKANEELQDISDAQTNLISNISHELRTPLVTIRGYSDLLFHGKLGEINKKQRISLLALKRNAERLIKQIDNIIDISSVELGKSARTDTELVNIPFIIEQSVEMVFAVAEKKHIAIEKQYDEEYLIVEGERDKLTRIFLNILDNAVKFNKRNGKVMIHCFRSNGTVVTEISDTGIGIPAKYHKVIFNRFFQVESSSKREYTGSGIGLSLSMELARLYKGSIEVKSKPKKGTTFIVSFPAKT